MQTKVNLEVKGKGYSGLVIPIHVDSALEWCARQARNPRIEDVTVRNLGGAVLGHGAPSELVHPLQTLQRSQY